MKITILLFCFPLLFLQHSFSQNPLVKQWDKRFGGMETDILTSFIQTADSGYILGGFTDSDSSGDKTESSWGSYDYWIVKIDSTGNKQWDKRYGGTLEDDLYWLQQTFNGGYILGGTSWSDSSGDKTFNRVGTLGHPDYWIVRIDASGNKQWDRTFGGTLEESFTCLQQIATGGYIVGGMSRSGISGSKSQGNWDVFYNTFDYWILKIGSNGIKQWDKTFGGKQNEWLSELHQTTDGGYILGGSSTSDTSGDKTQLTWGDYDYWIVKIDSSGNKQWDKRFGGSDYDALFAIRQTSDGGYISGGISRSGISGDKTDSLKGLEDYWIVKIDSAGNKIWDKDFGAVNDEDIFGNITLTDDGSYLLTGTSYSPMSGDKSENNLGLEQGWILKIDTMGNKLWDKTIFTTGHDELTFALQTTDQCFAIAVTTPAGIGGYKTQPNWNPNNLIFDYWIVKFCDTTVATFIPIIHHPSSTFNISPNPANDFITINYNLSASQPTTISLFNIFGQKLKTILDEHQPAGTHEIKIDLKDADAGIYFVKLSVDGREEVRKIVIE